MCTVSITALAADPKPLPGQAGNDNIELTASAFLEKAEIQQVLGATLDAGYVVIRVKATPKTGELMRIGPDDFTLISRKDGERANSLAPNQIAGGGSALVVKSAPSQGGGVGSQPRRTIGIGGIGGGGVGTAKGADGGLDTKIEESDDKKTSGTPLMEALKSKALMDNETKGTTEGLLYFALTGKVKPKDLSLIYKGPGGKLVMDFQNAKGGR